MLHKQIRLGYAIATPTDGINVLEQRQTPHLFGLGLIESISRTTIESNADPEDLDADGISGRAHILPDGRVGRLGWKAGAGGASNLVMFGAYGGWSGIVGRENAIAMREKEFAAKAKFIPANVAAFKSGYAEGQAVKGGEA